MDDEYRSQHSTRRRFLAAGLGVGTIALAGCQIPGLGGNGEVGTVGEPAWYGSGPGAFPERPVPGGTSITELPPLEGSLTVYSGRGESLVGDLLSFLQRAYPEFTLDTVYDSAASLANRIDTEGDNTQADVFYSVNAGALGFLASNGHVESLTAETTDLVPGEFRADDGTWVGTSGRARTVPFNTGALTADEIPESIMAFPEAERFADVIGWAPTYSSFQGFVTAMRILEGDDATREWLQGMMDLGVQRYADEFQIAQAVADGNVDLGFANHYYTLRVEAGRPEAPIDIAFTQDDAGSVFNVAGAARTAASPNGEMADRFVRHLLSAEAQEYFAIRTFEYPLIEGVDPVGELPPVSELSVPSLDLSRLSNLDETIALMRDVGVL
jgi:iron(III) transport system substrate-binding protein